MPGLEPQRGFEPTNLPITNPNPRSDLVYQNAQMVTRFVDDRKARGLSQKGIAFYNQGLDRFLRYIEKPILSVAKEDIERFLSVLTCSPGPHPSRLSVEQHLAARLALISPSRASTDREVLKSFFTYLHDARLWSYNPLGQVKAWRIPRRERTIPTEDEVRRLLWTKVLPDEGHG